MLCAHLRMGHAEGGEVGQKNLCDRITTEGKKPNANRAARDLILRPLAITLWVAPKGLQMLQRSSGAL